MSVITLKNMEFHAYHGCMEHEQQLGNTFLVTVSINIDTELARQTDHLNDTLNYAEVYNVVKRQMLIPSKLIEHSGQMILENIFENFPQISFVSVELSKLNPPLGGKVESVSIQLEKNR
ncbi:MAG TPA: dihydroneopterin aldolase [Paludibacter sp.]|nr:dihydroneopterin aldolase [Paludibacter sp.]